jgi:hypothetical protein
MSLPVLRRIAELADAGATVAGAKPTESPSFADDPAQFRQLVDRLWGSGKIRSDPAGAVLTTLGIAPDWQPGSNAPPLWGLHRTLEDRDIYFMSSRSKGASRAEISFRVTGRAPELWDADTGRATPLSYRMENGRTVVPLSFDPSGSAFIVFRAHADTPSRAIPEPVDTPVADLSTGWTLSFQPGRGGPETPLAVAAGSWSESSDPRIRYFSGTGIYAREVSIDPRQLHHGRMLLDLGTVGEVADVTVNGTLLRTLWKPPYELDITDALKPGRNLIELRVTNLWVNRLIGDAQPGARPITFTVAPTYRPGAALAPSGLIGPVRLFTRH